MNKVSDLKHKQWEKVYESISNNINTQAILEHAKELTRVLISHGAEETLAYELGLESAITIYVSNYIVYGKGPA